MHRFESYKKLMCGGKNPFYLWKLTLSCWSLGIEGRIRSWLFYSELLEKGHCASCICLVSAHCLAWDNPKFTWWYCLRILCAVGQCLILSVFQTRPTSERLTLWMGRSLTEGVEAHWTDGLRTQLCSNNVRCMKLVATRNTIPWKNHGRLSKRDLGKASLEGLCLY